MQIRSFDLKLIILITIVTFALVFTSVRTGVIMVIFALLLAFIFPGYAAITAALPYRELLSTEKLLFTLGLSLAFVSIGGLILNLTPCGLNRISWTIFLGIITAISIVIAYKRRLRNNPDHQGRFIIGLNLRHGLYLGMAVIVVIASFEIAQLSAHRNRTSGFTQLWLLPIDSNNHEEINIGLSSMELVTTMYKLQLKVGSMIIREWSPIELKPGEQWKIICSLPIVESDIDAIEAVLYRLDDPGVVYRHVILHSTD